MRCILKLTTDKHEASRGLSAIAELLVLYKIYINIVIIPVCSIHVGLCSAKVYDDTYLQINVVCCVGCMTIQS